MLACSTRTPRWSPFLADRHTVAVVVVVIVGERREGAEVVSGADCAPSSCDGVRAMPGFRSRAIYAGHANKARASPQSDTKRGSAHFGVLITCRFRVAGCLAAGSDGVAKGGARAQASDMQRLGLLRNTPRTSGRAQLPPGYSRATGCGWPRSRTSCGPRLAIDLTSAFPMAQPASIGAHVARPMHPCVTCVS